MNSLYGQYLTYQIYSILNTILICMIILLFWVSTVWAGSQEEVNSTNETEQSIQSIFNDLESIGNASNAGGGAAAGLMALSIACQKTTNYFSDLDVFEKPTADHFKFSFLSNDISQWIGNRLLSSKNDVLQMSCARLQGQDVSKPFDQDTFVSFLQTDILPTAIQWGKNSLNNTKLPFLSNIEITAGGSRDGLFSSILTIEPLWVSDDKKDHVFTQLSWYAAPKDKTTKGYRTQYDTINAGLVYRTLSSDDRVLFGSNVFIDYAPSHDHWRGSVGVDAQTSQFGASINRYFPISTWQQLDDYYEERVSAGWDVQLHGQVPELPSWTGLMTTHQWDAQENEKNEYGIEAGFEYSPVPVFAVRTALADNNQDPVSFETSFRFKWDFYESADVQWRSRTELVPVKDRIYSKVNREDIIRVSQRRRTESRMIIVETTGANTVTQESGSLSVAAGQSLLMPATISVANSVGAIVRLQLSDGSILSAGQNTQVRIEPRVITLISGTIQFTSNGIISIVNTPGAVITLHGTDLDVVSNGTNSTVRLRDGSITVAGTVSGQMTLSSGGMAESLSGSVASVANGSGTYITHTDQVSVYIDRVGSAQTSEHVTPYPYAAPSIQIENLLVGQDITFRLPYNQSVDVSGVPRLQLTINGNSRTASYLSGSGTSDLLFRYTILAGDSGASSISLTGLDLNGGIITGNNKTAITTIADALLTLSASISGGDTTAPSGYTIAFTTDPINNGNKASAAFTISSAETGATYNYTMSSSGGGANVTGSGTASSGTVNVTGIDVSGLGDGTLTVSVTMTDSFSNVGPAATDTVVKDVVAPTISSVTPPSNGTYEP